MLAPDNREPKIKEAWFNSSLKIKQPWKNTHKKISLQSKTIDYKKKNREISVAYSSSLISVSTNCVTLIRVSCYLDLISNLLWKATGDTISLSDFLIPMDFISVYKISLS